MAVPTAALQDPPGVKSRGVVKVTSMKARGAVSQPEGRWRTRPAERPFLLEHDILKVTNVDSVDWEFKWDRRKYLVRVGETGFIPFPAVMIKMGDPRSVPDMVTRFNTDDGQRGVIATRHDSFVTLFAHYGIGNEDLEELVDFAPKLEVRTMSDDMEVQFPAQNPEMLPWPVPQAPQPGRENSDTRRMLSGLEDENRSMREELDELRSMISGKLNPGEAPPQGRSVVQGEDNPDDLAAALAGATIDQGPASQVN
jgi:hypothetical protein